MSASEFDLFHFGAIVGTHGLKGDLKVRPSVRASTLLCEASEVVIRVADGSEFSGTPVRAVPHKGNILLRLKEHENINLVSGFVGGDVLMRRTEVPASDGEQRHWQEIEGFEVTDRRCGSLGTLEDIFTTAAHDVYVVQGPFGEVLIPAVEQFITEVDQAGKRMTVDLPEGLVPDSDEN